MEFLDKNGLQHMLESLKPHIGSATPDWNAKEGQDGFIKNRTHYEETEVLLHKNTRELVDGESFFVPKTGVPLYIWSQRGRVIGLPNSRVEIPCIGRMNLILDLIYMGSQWQVTVVQTTEVPNDIFWGIYNLFPLEPKYIPDTIARQEYVESLEERIVQLEEKIANL